ncbi:hypothetical protein BDU57DRAFT_583910 [Ampelomyces quisqualis]|uniref:Uncharacterized protein n=1 Tax=Ampelomyces quisqualis TaxID=50730 RepID=A0A6A5R0P7_AMPQU|nr:hypothetical protein BDU57DRAFT_583910 [Ampelomyces quisqualis]
MQRTTVSPFVGTVTSQFAPQQATSMQADMSNMQGRLSQVTLTESRPWTEDEAKFAKFESLKNVALGNYIVLGTDEDEKTFCAALVCSRESSSKILRTVTSDCPIKAAHALVNQLQKDSMPLLMSHGAGSQLHGQQGYTNHLTQKFELVDKARIDKPEAPVDDTETLPGRKIDTYIPYGAPRGPRGHRTGYKRTRREDDCMAESQMNDRYRPDTKMEEGQIGLDFYD